MSFACHRGLPSGRQQMRGSSSPCGRVQDALAPDRRAQHDQPGVFGGHLADARASRPSGCARRAASAASASAAGTKATSLPSLATSSGSRPRARRRRARRRAPGSAASSTSMPRRAARGDLDQDGAQAARGWDRAGVGAGAGRQQSGGQLVQRRAVAGHLAARARAPRAARGWPRRDRPGFPRPARRRRARRPRGEIDARRDTPTPEVLMNSRSAQPRPTTLVSPVTMGTPPPRPRRPAPRPPPAGARPAAAPPRG